MAVLNEERIQWIDGMKTPSYTSLLSSNGGKWWRGGWQHTHWTITPTSCMGFSTTQRRIFVIGRVPSEGKQKFFLNFHSHLLLLMLYFLHFRWLLSPILSSPRLHRGRLLLRLCPMGNLLSIVIVPFLRLHRGRLLLRLCPLGTCWDSPSSSHRSSFIVAVCYVLWATCCQSSSSRGSAFIVVVCCRVCALWATCYDSSHHHVSTCFVYCVYSFPTLLYSFGEGVFLSFPTLVYSFSEGVYVTWRQWPKWTQQWSSKGDRDCS